MTEQRGELCVVDFVVTNPEVITSRDVLAMGMNLQTTKRIGQIIKTDYLIGPASFDLKPHFRLDCIIMTVMIAVY